MGQRLTTKARSVWIVAALGIILASDSRPAELPPEIQVDRLLIQAERQSASGEHVSAVSTLQRALGVYEEHDLEIPADFWFLQAGAQQRAGLQERAIEAVTRYLQKAGREGKHYRDALKILDAAEVDLAEVRRAEARVQAVLERAEREAAAKAAIREVAQARPTKAPEMIVVPSGTFRMGCLSMKGIRGRGMGRNCPEPELPAHKVRIISFQLAKHETTVEEFNHFLDATGKPRVNSWRSSNDLYHAEDPQAPDYSRRPVMATWDAVHDYLSWLSRRTGVKYRLPTESEWEYAARAGTTTQFHFGNDPGELCQYANFNGVIDTRASGRTCDDGFENVAPIGSFLANSWGFHDMLGNGEEWVQDCFRYERGYRAAKGDGTAVELDCAVQPRGGIDFTSGIGGDPSGKYPDAKMRVVRGGNAHSAWYWVRSAHRGQRPEDMGAAIRVAADISQALVVE